MSSLNFKSQKTPQDFDENESGERIPENAYSAHLVGFASVAGVPRATGNSIIGSSMGTSFSLSGEWSKTKGSAPAAVGMSVMRHLLKALLRRTGQNGLSLMEQELLRIGETPSTVKASQFADFVGSLSEHIEDPAARSAFLTRVLGD